MAWYDQAVFYHIYPLGLCGCAHENTGVAESHFDQLRDWAAHAARINYTAIYIGPLFESVGHGYETIDYRKVDCRLGTNDDFKDFVSYCHEIGLRVIVDGVFNHVGREFFAFKDVQEKREASPYCSWFCNLNFGGNNEYNDGFSYENWGGYNLLVKLNQQNPDVQNYLFDAIRFWVTEFDIDGIRLDAADVLDHGLMHNMRQLTDSLKPDFWLMGEVIHGDYSRWVNDQKLHSVTNYELHKGLYSGHNDHNYFEIAHSIKRQLGICGDFRLYTFMDNHDVERIYSKLNNKEHMFLVTLLNYTVYGIPSMYYGSEFGIDGRKEKGSDWNLRPYLDIRDYENAETDNVITALCKKLGQFKKDYQELTYGRYQELALTNRQFAYGRILDDTAMVMVLNNDDNPATVELNAPVGAPEATDLLGIAERVQYENGHLSVSLPANRGTVIYLGSKVAVQTDLSDQKVDTPVSSTAEKQNASAALDSGQKDQQESVRENGQSDVANNVPVNGQSGMVNDVPVDGQNDTPLKVLIINGSPHANGSTALALREAEKTLQEQGIETEMIQVGHLDIRSCIGCGQCGGKGSCVFDDIVNETAAKFEQADGLLVGSPVYYASANATLVAFLTRLFYSTPFDKRMKVGAAVVSARRGGNSATFDELNKFFTISGMPVASSQYWNSIHGNNAQEAAQDGEGLQVMRALGRNMGFLVKSIALGKQKYGLPKEEERIRTNFIR
ncbi:MAG: NAD(P)H-dependent oxidoreductase [Lachnospiraceae bacterium]|nr:NAD(P)H-dependent oxidoreductase [Lachnospiraceae bacterium]